MLIIIFLLSLASIIFRVYSEFLYKHYAEFSGTKAHKSQVDNFISSVFYLAYRVHRRICVRTFSFFEYTKKIQWYSNVYFTSLLTTISICRCIGALIKK